MPFCPNCGMAAEGRFCPACGTPISAAPGAPPPVTPAAPVTPASAPPTAALQDNVAGTLCYVLGLITGVLFLVLEPYNRNREIRFHAFQSIFLHVAAIALWIAMIILSGILSFVPLLGGFLVTSVWTLLGLGVLVLWVVLLVKTFNGQKMVLPIIGPLAQQQAGRA